MPLTVGLDNTVGINTARTVHRLQHHFTQRETKYIICPTQQQVQPIMEIRTEAHNNYQIKLQEPLLQVLPFPMLKEEHNRLYISQTSRHHQHRLIHDLEHELLQIRSQIK